MQIQFNIEIWKEGNRYVAYNPQLNLSSWGKTIEAAKKNFYEATEAFLEEAERMGSLEQILEEAGFIFDKNWKAPKILVSERMSLAL